MRGRAHRSGRPNRSCRVVTAVATITALATAAGLVGSDQARAQTPTVATFSYTGGTQQFVVPAGVCEVTVDAYGASGDEGENGDGRFSPGGLGGRATGSISVTPGETLSVHVGGQGNGRLGGFNGGGTASNADEEDGGGGGGASDIRRTPYALADRLLVAGGGGGGGADGDDYGSGGKGDGGDGGGLVGENGTDGFDGLDDDPGTPEVPTPAGKGGTQTAGGSAPTSFDPSATPGTFGQGGTGGEGRTGDDGGGGGAGGWYGGGGGAGQDEDAPSDTGAGGGGGSGVGPAGVTFETGVRSGDGQVEISYMPTTGCGEEIDWTMPKRFGLDENADGMVDYYSPDGSLVIEPSVWQVDLEHGDPTNCDSTLSREWTIDGLKIVPGDPNIVGTLDPHSCDLSYEFPKEDVFKVEIEVRDSSGALVGVGSQEVIVQDWLIVSVGDSVASGEGVPEIRKSPTRFEPEWQNARCHRSAKAGTAAAAVKLEDDDERTSVTFVHLACSGATIFEGLINAYRGIDPGAGGALPKPQIQQIAQLIPGREIDAILVSVGANDIEFSNILVDCFIWPSCDRRAAQRKLARLLPQLPTRFTSLNGLMQRTLPEVTSDRVYISEYYDPTRYDIFTVCGDGPAIDGTQKTREVLYDVLGSGPLFGVSAQEASWASHQMLPALNQQVRNASTAAGWTYVGSINGAFLDGHGYCAAAPWVVSWTESHANQGDKYGTIHPNEAGHGVYARRIRENLFADFYSAGDLTKPRLPQP